jgi:hypothetical protein
MRKRLNMEARRELIEAVGERYRQAGRVEKKQILDEVKPSRVTPVSSGSAAISKLGRSSYTPVIVAALIRVSCNSPAKSG